MKFHNGNIETLENNQVYTFGANKLGFHGAGSAGFASFGVRGNVWREYGYGSKPNGWKGRWNIKGAGEGFQEGTEGKSYAIPTVTRAGAKRSIPLEDIKGSISKFYRFATEHPDLEFLVAYSKGRNLNGYSHEEMMSVFKGDIPENVVFEFGFFDE